MQFAGGLSPGLRIPGGGKPMIPLANIRTDGGTQPRSEILTVTVQEYAREMQSGAKFPPVDVFYDGENYWLGDGFHRFNAADWRGEPQIECEIHQGTLEDAQWYSYGANRAHGLPRTNEDKQRAVKAALAHPKAAGMSDSEIARHVGVGADMVTRHKPIIRSTDDTPTATVTRAGKTYQQKRKSKLSQPAASADHESVEDRAQRAAHAEAQRTYKANGKSQLKAVDDLLLDLARLTKRFGILIDWLSGHENPADSIAFIHRAMEFMAAINTEVEQAALTSDPISARELRIGDANNGS
jgi:hypothetical protein